MDFFDPRSETGIPLNSPRTSFFYELCVDFVHVFQTCFQILIFSFSNPYISSRSHGHIFLVANDKINNKLTKQNKIQFLKPKGEPFS